MSSANHRTVPQTNRRIRRRGSGGRAPHGIGHLQDCTNWAQGLHEKAGRAGTRVMPGCDPLDGPARRYRWYGDFRPKGAAVYPWEKVAAVYDFAA